MSTETQKRDAGTEPATRYSAFDEFSRDERRPAVLLLGALIIAALFFAIGIWVGRLTVETNTHADAPSTAPPATTASPF